MIEAGPGDLRGVERAEQPARADDRAERDEHQAPEADRAGERTGGGGGVDDDVAMGRSRYPGHDSGLSSDVSAREPPVTGLPATSQQTLIVAVRTVATAPRLESSPWHATPSGTASASGVGPGGVPNLRAAAPRRLLRTRGRRRPRGARHRLARFLRRHGAAPLGPVPGASSRRPSTASTARGRQGLAARPGAHDPAAYDALRTRVVDTGLRSHLGELLGSPELARQAERMRAVIERADLGGRALAASYAALPWPDEPHLALWHAATLWREWRGDAHNAALVAHGLPPVDALVLYDAWLPAERAARGRGRAFLQPTRKWSDEEWVAAAHRLADLGRVRPESLEAVAAGGAPQATEEGRDLRDAVEVATATTSASVWVGVDDAEDLLAFRPFSKAVIVAASSPGRQEGLITGQRVVLELVVSQSNPSMGPPERLDRGKRPHRTWEWMKDATRRGFLAASGAGVATVGVAPIAFASGSSTQDTTAADGRPSRTGPLVVLDHEGRVGSPSCAASRRSSCNQSLVGDKARPRPRDGGHR